VIVGAPRDRVLRLVRTDLDGLPAHQVPAGYGLRFFGDGDEEVWLALQQAAEPMLPVADGTYARDFARVGPFRSERCLFLVAHQGRELGTITAWRGRLTDEEPPGPGASTPASFHAAIGRMRASGSWGTPAWLAVHPDHHGRRLSLPLISAAMQILRSHHDRALVRTFSSRPAAIKRWLQFGFRPDLSAPGAASAWRTVWASYPELETHLAGSSTSRGSP
jgi:GNAT superfamily N-acetyltransferase